MKLYLFADFTHMSQTKAIGKENRQHAYTDTHTPPI